MKKWLSLLLALALFVCLFPGCGKESPQSVDQPQPEIPADPDQPADEDFWKAPEDLSEPAFSIGNTCEERQAAIVAVALAYYYKGVYQQYDRQDMTHLSGTAGDVRCKENDVNTPEYGTADNTIYAVCSSFAYDVVRGALGWEMLGSAKDCVTLNLSQGNVPAETLIFQHDQTADTAYNEQQAQKCVSLLQPGDVITYNPVSGTGHTMIYAGDITGDGQGDLIHCTGAKYSFSSGSEAFEEEGGIRIDTAEPFLLTPGTSRYLAKKGHFSIVRPANISPEEYPITNAAKARMTYAGLEINRTAKVGNYGSVASGDELTYSIEIVNNGTADYTGLPVTDVVAENCTLVAVDGEKANGGDPAWKLNVKAGETVTVTYTVRADGQPGDTIVSCGGYVSAIPQNSITTTVAQCIPGENLLTEALARDAAAESPDSITFVNKLYQKAFGADPQIPSAEEVFETVFKKLEATKKTFVYMLNKKAEGGVADMTIPEYYGGMSFSTTGRCQRVLELRTQDLKTGDILILDRVLDDGKPGEAWIFNGSGFFTAADGTLITREQKDLTPLLSYDLFVLLRPSLTLKSA